MAAQDNMYIQLQKQSQEQIRAAPGWHIINSMGERKMSCLGCDMSGHPRRRSRIVYQYSGGCGRRARSSPQNSEILCPLTVVSLRASGGGDSGLLEQWRTRFPQGPRTAYNSQDERSPGNFISAAASIRSCAEGKRHLSDRVTRKSRQQRVIRIIVDSFFFK